MMLRDKITVRSVVTNSITGERTEGTEKEYPARVEWSGKTYADDNGQQLTSRALILTKPISISPGDEVLKITLTDGTVHKKTYDIKQVKRCGSYKIEHLEVLI